VVGAGKNKSCSLVSPYIEVILKLAFNFKEKGEGRQWGGKYTQ